MQTCGSEPSEPPQVSQAFEFLILVSVYRKIVSAEISGSSY